MISFDEISKKVTPYTLVSKDRLYVLYELAARALKYPGSFYECGVYRGGTAMLLASIAMDVNRKVKLFDTFTGMPDSHPEFDLHKKGDFADTSLEAVMDLLEEYPGVEFHPGLIPGTFPQNDLISFAHVDVDIYQSVLDCCEYISPRLANRGVIVFDDYGFSSCPGAKKAIDEFYKDKEYFVYRLPTKQAVVSNSPVLETAWL
jgi:O-methyltransferase